MAFLISKRIFLAISLSITKELYHNYTPHTSHTRCDIASHPRLTKHKIADLIQIMPYRKVPIVENEFYHIFNRSVARQPIFNSKSDYLRAINAIDFYQYSGLSTRFSFFNRLSLEEKSNFTDKLRSNNPKLVEIVAYCLMPNHFHFLLRSLAKNGISKFSANFQNSYAKYFNTKYNRNGSLFQNMFKAVLIENGEQLLHVSRYIHLNPHSSHLLARINEIKNYRWSSFPDYLGINQPTITQTKFLNGFFKSISDFEDFVLNHANYQRTLSEIKHLLLE